MTSKVFILAAAGLVLAACTMPESGTPVRVDGVTRWAEHPITKLHIRDCQTLNEKFGDGTCEIEYLR